MCPPPPRERGDHEERAPRGPRPEREPIDPMQALERLYAKKVITLEEGQAAAKLIDANAVFPRPPAAPAAPASAPGAVETGAPESGGANGGPESRGETEVPPG